MGSEPSRPRLRTIDVRMDPVVLAYVAVGGALGALARYSVSRLMPVGAVAFPWATFVTNVSGAFVLGCFLTVVIERDWPARYSRPLFAIGFLGAFTTFSTMAVETVTRVKDHHGLLGVGYLFGSVAAGLVACALGVVVGRLVARMRPREAT